MQREQMSYIEPPRYSMSVEPAVTQGAFFSKIVSTEFVGFATTAAVAIVMGFASIGLISSANAEDIAQKVSGIIGEVAALATLLAGLTKYGNWRTDLKKESLRTNVDRIMAERAHPATVEISKTTATETKE